MSDFEDFLSEVGLMPVDCERANDFATFDPTPMEGVYVDASPIHGVGLYLDRGVSTGAVIAPLWHAGTWTVAGRYVNHHPRPNTRPQRNGDRIDMVATHVIGAGQEVTLNYRDVRDALLGAQGG